MRPWTFIVNEYANSFQQTLNELISRLMNERGIKFEIHSEPVNGLQDQIALEIDSNIGTQSYRIDDAHHGGAIIVGGDTLGLVYGLGKWLRTCSFSTDAPVMSPWRGRNAPAKPFRGIYFATHFNNFYHEAPLSDIETYVEDLAL